MHDDQQLEQRAPHVLICALGASSCAARGTASTTAGTSSGGEDDDSLVTELTFLSHPFAWELQGQGLGPDELGADNRWGGFSLAELIAMEQQVSSKWVPAVRALGRGPVLLINHMVPEDEVQRGHGPSSQLSRAAREHMGDCRVVELYLAPPTNAVGREVASMLAARGLKMDPRTVVTQAWGQSTEGCAQWFASHFAVGLGLHRGFPLQYSLTFPDAPFMMRGEFRERLAVQQAPQGSDDVSAYLFLSATGQPFAMLLPGVMRDNQCPRTVRLRAAAGAVSFSNKRGEQLVVEAAGTDRWTEAGEQLLEWALMVGLEFEVGFVWGHASADRANAELELRRIVSGATVDD